MCDSLVERADIFNFSLPYGGHCQPTKRKQVSAFVYPLSCRSDWPTVMSIPPDHLPLYIHVGWRSIPGPTQHTFFTTDICFEKHTGCNVSAIIDCPSHSKYISHTENQMSLIKINATALPERATCNNVSHLLDFNNSSFYVCFSESSPGPSANYQEAVKKGRKLGVEVAQNHKRAKICT